MDLRTVGKKLRKGKYQTYEDFFTDVQLIWDNCKNYNAEGSDIYKMADTMEYIAMRAINKSKEELGIPLGENSN